jgi:hypothetical protein
MPKFAHDDCALLKSPNKCRKHFRNVGQNLPDYTQNIQEDSDLCTCRHDDLKSHLGE